MILNVAIVQWVCVGVLLGFFLWENATLPTEFQKLVFALATALAWPLILLALVLALALRPIVIRDGSGR